MKYVLALALLLPVAAVADEAKPAADASVTLTVSELTTIIDASVAQALAQEAARRAQGAMAKYRAQTEPPPKPKAEPLR